MSAGKRLSMTVKNSFCAVTLPVTLALPLDLADISTPKTIMSRRRVNRTRDEGRPGPAPGMLPKDCRSPRHVGSRAHRANRIPDHSGWSLGARSLQGAVESFPDAVIPADRRARDAGGMAARG